jgi:O-antigen ligase
MVSITATLPIAAILGLAPLLTGSRDLVGDAPADVVEAGWSAVYCLFLAWALLLVPFKPLTRAQLALLFPPFCLMLVGAVVLWLQVSSSWVPPGIWVLTSEFLGISLHASPSVAPYKPLLNLGSQFSFFLAFLCGFFVSTTTRRNFLMEVLALFGIIYAFIAVGFSLYDYSDVMWLGRPGTLDSLTFPFSNRNHAATFYGSCSILCMAWILAHFEALRKTGRFSDLYWNSVHSLSWRTALWAAGFLVCITATFLTKSRAGVLLTILMLGLCGGLFVSRTLGRRPLTILVAGAAGFIFLIFMELWGSGGLAGRIANLGLQDVERFSVYHSTIGIVRDHPWLGTGLGTFVLAFPSYRSHDLGSTLIWDKAHNTLLEIAAEQGLPFAICLTIVFLYVGLRLLRCVLKRQSLDYTSPALFVGLLGLLHSFVDFPLQNIGFSVFFAALVGCGYSHCAERSGTSAGTSRKAQAA